MMECAVGTENYFYVVRDLVGSNKNSIAYCIFYLTKTNNPPEDGS